MNRYRCVVEYMGGKYDGWQSQTLGTSIQEQIEAALLRITGKKTNIIASGRTDAGVNARMQVFMFDTEREMKERKWMGAINAFLPDDIHILDVKLVTFRFHARYNVRWKKYAYRINIGPYDVFTKDYEYQCPIKLDFEAMKQAAQYLVGTHDFTSLNSSPLSEYPDQTRTIQSIDLQENNGHIVITYCGKGFLRYMVRMMSAQLIEAGRHRIMPQDIEKILAAKSRTKARRNAPACGLTLEEVNYFEIAALDEGGMIREYLQGDDLPTGMTLKETEAEMGSRTYPLHLVMTTRHSQQMLARVVITPGETQIFSVCREGRNEAVSLLVQFRQWLGMIGLDAGMPVIIR